MVSSVAIYEFKKNIAHYKGIPIISIPEPLRDKSSFKVNEVYTFTIEIPEKPKEELEKVNSQTWKEIKMQVNLETTEPLVSDSKALPEAKPIEQPPLPPQPEPKPNLDMNNLMAELQRVKEKNREKTVMEKLDEALIQDKKKKKKVFRLF